MPVPMDTGTADAVARQEGAEAADRQRRLVEPIAEGDGLLRRLQEQFLPNGIAQFVRIPARREIGAGVALGAALQRQHL